MERLTGQELLAKLAGMEGASKSDQARAAGYIRILDDGTQKSDFLALYSALLEAKKQLIVAKENPEEKSEKVANPNSLEYWSTLDEDQIETHLCYMNVVPPAAMITKLATSLNPSIRETLAELLETPKEVLSSLVIDEEETVREAASLSLARILIGRLLPRRDFLSLLASDNLDDASVKKVFALGSQELQNALASNSNISEVCLEELLATHPVDWIETILMQNLAKRRLPKSFVGLDEKKIIELVSEELPEESVLESLTTLFLDSCDNRNSLCFFLADNNSTPPGILELLVKKCDWLIKQQVASNQAVPSHLLALLANDPEYRVRQAVAKSDFATSEILDILSLDASDVVRAAVGLRRLPREWQNLGHDLFQKKLQSDQLTEAII